MFVSCCGPVVDFTTLQPFDFKRNLFKFHVCVLFSFPVKRTLQEKLNFLIRWYRKFSKKHQISGTGWYSIDPNFLNRRKLGCRREGGREGGREEGRKERKKENRLP